MRRADGRRADAESRRSGRRLTGRDVPDRLYGRRQAERFRMARNRRFRRGLGPAERFDVEHQHHQRETHVHPSGNRHLRPAAQAYGYLHDRSGYRHRREADRNLAYPQDRGRRRRPEQRRHRRIGEPGAAEPAGTTGQRPAERSRRHGHRLQPGHLPAPVAGQDPGGQGRAHYRHAEDLHPRRHRGLRRHQVPDFQRLLEQGDRDGQQPGIQA